MCESMILLDRDFIFFTWQFNKLQFYLWTSKTHWIILCNYYADRIESCQELYLIHEPDVIHAWYGWYYSPVSFHNKGFLYVGPLKIVSKVFCCIWIIVAVGRYW